jgi:hypothetical protein
MAPTSTLISASALKSRWASCILELPLTISAFIFGFSVVLSALALITVASNINKLRTPIAPTSAGATNVDSSRLPRN